MTLLIKNGEYAFLIRLNIMFSMSSWKDFQLLQTLSTIKHFIKLILNENDAKLLKFQSSPVWVDLWHVWSVRY